MLLDISMATGAIRFSEGILHLEIKSPALKANLSMKLSQIILELNQQLREKAVKKIILV